jgi:uncharacterized protein (DUF1499 family)
MTDMPDAPEPRGTRWCRIGSIPTGIGLALVVAGPIAARLGMLSPVAAFMSYGIGLLLSKGTGGGAAPGRPWGALIVACLVLGLSFANYPSGEAPDLHDLSTDLDEPPAFVALVPIRAADAAQNPPEYAGEATAELQRDAFPELETLQLAATPDAAFAAASQAVRELGWEVVAEDAAAGRIEATDTTAWFRFKDDVVIRIRAAGGGSAVDVRSKSRVGRGDMGTNAARIREFLATLEAAAG